MVGLVQAFGVVYLSGTVANMLVFAVMIVTLIFRPLGLFGIRR
jgi:branched-subunit amino acid ABC-type transport system permease component